MPTKREREYYQLGFQDGVKWLQTSGATVTPDILPFVGGYEGRGKRMFIPEHPQAEKGFIKKRKLSAWNKFVKANAKKPRFRYRNGKLNLKKMAIAFRRQKKR